MEEGRLKAAYSSARTRPSPRRTAEQAIERLERLDLLVVQDIFLTKTARMADVVLPATAAWCETDGTTTNSERRVQRVRKAVDPPGEAREDIDILCELAATARARLDYDDAEDIWDELRSLSPDPLRDELRTAGGAPGHPVALPLRGPGSSPPTCTAGCGSDPAGARGRPAPFAPCSSTTPRST